jgi:hypothetical protein
MIAGNKENAHGHRDGAPAPADPPLFASRSPVSNLRHLDDEALARLRAAFEEHSALVMHRTTVAGEGPRA